MDARTNPARATPKSLRTRARILDAATRLFAEVGYHAATNGMIADAAKLTRGAMLYHFATREELVEAAVAHIEIERARLFEAAARASAAQASAGPGQDASEAAIDAYWTLLHTQAFVAFAELEAAARTEPMLRPRLAAAQAAFDRAQVGGGFGALAQAGADARFQTSRDLGRFLLEGMAKGALTYDEPARRERLLAVVKRAVRMLNRKGDVQDLWD
ncbi:helix-turn-helix domain-containing protein [Phenylobacterium sp.]|jgi:AcrR family transcriptional regulator|uniref:TetR/AcrR family transcriptional regulator n=1 Tax=Phenylobacterium sp. TaxID=1871053 RepID=UPI002F3EAD9C